MPRLNLAMRSDFGERRGFFFFADFRAQQLSCFQLFSMGWAILERSCRDLLSLEIDFEVFASLFVPIYFLVL